MKKFLSFLIVFLLGGLLFYAITIYFPGKEALVFQDKPDQAPTHQTGLYGPAPVNGPDFTEAASKSVDAVVHIRSQFRTKSQGYDDFFGALREYLGYESRPERSYPISGLGSGVILSSDGYIATNNHVVDGAEFVEVILNDKRVYEGKVIGLDPSTDLALLKIDIDGLPHIKYGNSDLVRVGEWVLAVGNPFNLTSTVTAGIVSAKARDINILGSLGAIESFIQTDAAVNKGNSGGALVNIHGELIGINAAIASSTGYFQGYSFAIPVNIVKKVMGDLKEYGEVQRAYIGVIIREIDQDFADDLGLDEIRGVYVDGLVEDGGAMDAGIEIGDVITEVEGTDVNSLAQLLEIVGQHSPGQELDVEVLRDGSVDFFVVELRSQDGGTAVVRRVDEFYSEHMGASLSPLTKEEKESQGLRSGLKVVNLDEGLLSKGGIRKGFILTAVNGYAVESKTELELAFKKNPDRVKISGIYPDGMSVTFEFGL